MTPSIYNKALRERRKAAGETEVRVWLCPSRQADLKSIQEDAGLSAQGAISAAIFQAAQTIRRK